MRTELSQPAKCYYEFGPFRLDAAGGRLLRGGEEVLLRENGRAERLPPKAADLLLCLVRSGGRTVGREELINELWPDAFVEDNRLSDNVSTLRKYLGDQAKSPRYVETVPKRGYRFLADVRETREEPAPAFEQTRTRIVVEEETEPPRENRPDAAAPPAAGALPWGAGRSRRRLKTAALAVAALPLVALGAFLYARRGGEVRAPLARTVAVLPFKPLVAESRDPALELGMTDALISKLSNIRQLTVRPTSSVMKYADGGQDLCAAGSELGVEVLLDGKVQRAGERVRLSVQLVRAADGATVWAEKFDEKFTDIFAVQDAISERAAAALALRLTGEEKRGLAKHHTDNVAAYELYLQGRQHWSTFTYAGREKSINYYNEALRLDPDYALAYAGLANTYIVTGIYGPPTAAEVLPKAREAVRRALELDEGLAEAHVASGAFKMFYERDWEGGARALRRAMELSPGDPDAPDLYGYYLTAMGRADEAAASHRRARDLSPQWHVPAHDLLDAIYFARRYDEAIEQSRQTLRLEPNDGWALWVLAKSLNMKGRPDEAAAELRRGLGAHEVGQHMKYRMLGELGYTYAVSGRRADAAKVIGQLEAKDDPWRPVLVARVYAGAGDRERAFEWLARAADESFPFLHEVKAEPQFDGLRTDPRYAALMRRINLTP